MKRSSFDRFGPTGIGKFHASWTVEVFYVRGFSFSEFCFFRTLQPRTTASISRPMPLSCLIDKPANQFIDHTFCTHPNPRPRSSAAVWIINKNVVMRKIGRHESSGGNQPSVVLFSPAVVVPRWQSNVERTIHQLVPSKLPMVTSRTKN